MNLLNLAVSRIVMVKEKNIVNARVLVDEVVAKLKVDHLKSKLEDIFCFFSCLEREECAELEATPRVAFPR